MLDIPGFQYLIRYDYKRINKKMCLQWKLRRPIPVDLKEEISKVATTAFLLKPICEIGGEARGIWDLLPRPKSLNWISVRGYLIKENKFKK